MPESAVEIARRLELRGQDSSPWIAILATEDAPEFALENFRTDVSSLLQKSARTFAIAETTFEQLTESLRNPDDDIAILIVDQLTPEQWSSFDLTRSAIERKGPIVLWGSANSVEGLTEYAPNVRSYLGSSVFPIGTDGGIMTEAEQTKRLQELSEHYGITNEDVVHRAESGTLSREPHFIEWLALLGRGDLV